MNWRVTALLFLILAGLIGYLVWQNQRDETAVVEQEIASPLPPTPERVTLIQTSPELVQRVNIIDLNSGEEISFVQSEPGQWTQAIPTETAVVTPTLNTAVAGVVNLISSRSIKEEVNPLSAYGLENPAYQINIATSRPEEDVTIRVTLEIGNQTPSNTGYYVTKQGDSRIHILPTGIIDNLINLLTMPPDPLPPPETS